MVPLSTDAVREFAVFAEQLNFTRAARELHISQPALHVKVRKLSEQLGVPLYVREGRHLALTPAGEAVGRLGRQIEGQLRAVVDELGGAQAPPVVLAAGEGAHVYVLGQAVQRLLAAGVRLRLLNTDGARAVKAVTSGEADIAVAVISDLPRSLEGTAIGSYPQVAALPATHRLAQQRSISLRDLDGEALVVPPPGRPLRKSLTKALRAAPARWSVAVEADGWQAMLRFVALGLGIAVVNGCVDPPAGVVTRPVIELPDVAYTALHRPDGPADPRIATVLDAIRASAP